MECGSIEERDTLETGFRKNSKSNDGNGRPKADDVKTLYSSCDSNLLLSSETSVQIFSAYASYNVTGCANQNFCDLDIVSKREKPNTLQTLQTISEELRCLPMYGIVNENRGVFRKKKSEKAFSRTSEVLNLGTVLISDKEVRSKISSTTKEQKDDVKKKRSKSKRSNEIGSQSTLLETNFMNNKDVTKNFNDLENAKMMYYANLPNKSAFTDKEAKKPAEEIINKHKSQKKKRSDQSIRKKSEVLETTDPKLGKIIINKIDSDVIQAVSSQNSQSTIKTKQHINSEISLDVFGYTNKNTKYKRIHHNSPDSDASRKTEKPKIVDVHNKRSKKHQTSRQSSDENHGKVKTETEHTKEIKKKRTKKKKHSKKSSTLENGFSTNISTLNTDEQDKKTPEGNDSKKQTKSPIDSQRKKTHHKKKESNKSEPNQSDPTKSEPTKSEPTKSEPTKSELTKSESTKTKEIVRCDDDSVLKIYVADKLLPSESCTIVADEEFCFTQKLKKRRHSRRSKSRGLSQKYLGSPSTSNNTNAESKIEEPKPKDKKRLKSRVAKKENTEQSHKVREETRGERKKSITNLPSVQREKNKSKSREGSKARSLEKKGNQTAGKNVKTSGYLGHVLPTEVAERFAMKPNSSHGTKRSKQTDIEVACGENVTRSVDHGDVASYKEKVPYDVPDQLLYAISKEKSKRSKSCAPEDPKQLKSLKGRRLMPSKSHIFCRNRSSEITVNRRRPRSKRSKSCFPKERHFTKQYTESKEKLCDELKKLTTFQHVNPARKRFKVYSTLVQNTGKSREPTASHVEDFVENKSISHRFNLIQSNDRDKEAILRLPIFKNQNQNRDADSSARTNDLIGIAIDKENDDDQAQQDDVFDENLKIPKRKKRPRKSVFRREVSFSQLNVTPYRDFYKRSSKLCIPKTLLSPDVAAVTKVDKINSFLWKLRKKRDDNSKSPSIVESKLSERSSDETDWSVDKKKFERKLSFFHFVLGERIMEISTKATGTDGNIVIGFTVSGTEPPKRLRSGEKNKNRQIFAKTCKLHMTFLPAIEIIENATNSMPTSWTSLETKQIEGRNINPQPTNQSIKRHTKTKKISVLHRKKMISTAYKNVNKRPEHSSQFVNSDAANIKKSSSESVKEERIDVDSKFKLDKQELRSRSRTNNALKVLESSLQIIKEESQSTDTSSRTKPSQKKRSKSSISDLKEDNQTNHVNEEIAKIKEVINFLYHSIDLKKEESLVKTQNDSSSTETSGYREQFKNIVKNAKPKFNSFKRLQKSDDNVRNLKKSNGSKDQTPERKPISKKNVSMTMIDSVSSEEKSSTSDSKIAPKFSKIPRQISKRSKSADLLSTSYFEKYKNTKELIESRKKTKEQEKEALLKTSDKAVLTEKEIKSNSSSDVSNKNSINANSLLGFAVNTKEGLFMRESVEKYVQCTPEETLELKNEKQVDCNLSAVYETVEKDFAEKSLQTSERLANEDLKNVDCSCNCGLMSCELLRSDRKSSKKRLYEEAVCKKRSSNSSSNSLNKAIIENAFEDADMEKLRKKSNKNDKSLSKFEKLKKVFSNKEDKSFQKDVYAYNTTEKRTSKRTLTRPTPELDYANFVKLERHLAEVLGLYPSICKAIRAQMDDSTLKNIDRKIKEENPDLFSSKSSLATTVDTITEYKKMDSEELPNVTKPKNENGNSGHCHCFDSKKSQLVEEFVNCHNFPECQYGEDSSVQTFSKVYRKKIEKNKERNSTDTTTSSCKAKEADLCKFCKQSKWRKEKRANFKKKDRSKCALKESYDNSLSVTSVFSNEKCILSSSSSNSLLDNWSVASPLHSRTTASMNFSAIMSQTSKSSKSLTTLNKMLPGENKMEIKKSKSLVEMSTHKNVNRKLTVQHLLDLKCNHENAILQALNEEKPQSILLLSVSSSCTVFATPSTFLAKVERHLQFDKTLQKNIYENKIMEKSSIDENYQKENKIKMDEQSYHSVLFSDKNVRVKSITSDDREKQRPFYIHRSHSVSDGEFVDSLEIDVQKTRNQDEDDMGNFSADSLEANDKKNIHKAKTYEMLNDHLAKREYLVYSATVKYDKDSNKQGKNSSNKNPNYQLREREGEHTASTSVKKSRENISNTLISESGYESTKSKRTASIKNFFKKGGSLLDLFRNSSKNIKTQKLECEESSCSNLTSFSNLWAAKNKEENFAKKNVGVGLTKDKSSEAMENKDTAKVYWCNINKPVTGKKITFNQGSMTPEKKEKKSSTKPKEGYAQTFTNCVKTYKRQVDECHAYAEKVILESQLRKEGYYKQYQEFKEIPLELLIGKKMPTNTKYKRHGSASTQVTPRSKATSIQTEAGSNRTRSSRASTSGHRTSGFNSDNYESDNDHKPKIIAIEDNEVRSLSIMRKNSPTLSYESDILDRDHRMSLQNSVSRVKFDKENPATHRDTKHHRKAERRAKDHPKKEYHEKDQSKGTNSTQKIKLNEVYENIQKSLTKTLSKSPTSGTSIKAKAPCTCDKKIQAKMKEVEKKIIPELVKPFKGRNYAMIRGIVGDIVNIAMDKSNVIKPVEKKYDVDFDGTMPLLSVASEIETIPITKVVTEEKPKIEPVKTPKIKTKEPEKKEEIIEQPIEEELIEDLKTGVEANEEFRKGLTDKEVFDKLLNSYEKEDTIATRLSKDEEFFKAQIKTIKRDSDESFENEHEEGNDGREQANLNEVIYTEDPIGGKHRNTHFWEEKMKVMRAKEDNPVNTDDIGTCFSRGFRPDNIALSGDACFSLNKQDKLKFPKGMLTNEESIIDFSERETPLDYLLALGFMVDEASNALKDEDIRSRLLAAITEARVWINKITTTQGTLLYLVAYKSRPKTMRYFLQLVEAIINKRINNAIKLDGFLRVLEKVEEGEIQMINILGADKFEDEENEEKIVKKQLRQLFITVYKIAERESMQKGKQLSQQAIVLLRILAAKYRAGLHPHLELIARYIGQELLNTETQLEAAMIFLSRLDTAEVKLKEFEAYCDIKCEKKKRSKSPKPTTSNAV